MKQLVLHDKAADIVQMLLDFGYYRQAKTLLESFTTTSVSTTSVSAWMATCDLLRTHMEAGQGKMILAIDRGTRALWYEPIELSIDEYWTITCYQWMQHNTNQIRLRVDHHCPRSTSPHEWRVPDL